MANPRELAEQAFALLQNALRDSEARASDLDEQIKRKRQPKNRIEEQLDVLTHRLEIVEAERERWERQAGHLEEVAEAERAKVAQLKKKLEIAESGPEKLTKKEINFWRAKAEDIDTETKDYKERLASLRRDLFDRDALIEQLRSAAPPAPVEPAAAAAEADAADAAQAELQRQVEQRDQWLVELRHELHDLRTQQSAHPEPSLETQAEIETLRQQLASFELALAEAHNARASVQADLGHTQQELSRLQHEFARLQPELIRLQQDVSRSQQDLAAAQHELSERDRLAREAEATNERARTTLNEREHRLVELSAEVEHLRNDLRQREQATREAQTHRDEQLAALSRDLSAERGHTEQYRHDASIAEAELGQTRAALAAAEQRAADRANELVAELDRQREALAADRAELQQLRAQQTQRDTDIDSHRQQLAQRDHELIELRRQFAERERELGDRQQQLRDLGQRLVDREHKESVLAGELEHARTTAATSTRELTSLRDTLLGTNRELDQLRNLKQSLESELADVLARADTATSEAAAAKEQIAGLEAELKEEKEHAENLGELANERREHMTKLQEQLEEAEERYADANWRLSKSLYFERIVKRRRTLIAKLLAALRAKMKANVALKAGLDGLRTYKAAAEMNQQKLLQRLEHLKTDLREAEEAVARKQGDTLTKEDLAASESRATALEERLNTQAELIQSLEADLKAARLMQKGGEERNHEMELLIKELEAKNQVITQLQTDTDEQQRKLSKLRGSESETVRLKALTEKDRSEIEALQREVAQLREALVRQSSGATTSNDNQSELEAKLRERENSVTRLMGTIKEHEATIKKLNEAAEGWKRKYQFLATDSPDAYKAAAEK